MKRLRLKDWAALAEILGTIAVVISLLFVAHSINLNTTVLQSLNDNLLYDYDNLRIDDIVRDPSMAAILVKLKNGETLSDVENVRFIEHKSRILNMWELAHDRHQDGLFPEDKWLGWNSTLANVITQGPLQLPEEEWKSLRHEYGAEFALLVDAAYNEIQ